MSIVIYIIHGRALILDNIVVNKAEGWLQLHPSLFQGKSYSPINIINTTSLNKSNIY